MSNTENDDTTWIDGFNNAVVNYLIGRDFRNEGSVWNLVKGNVQTHMETCTVTEVLNVDQNVEEFSVFDSFDNGAHRITSMLSATFTCACGEYTAKHLSYEGDLTDIIRGVIG